MSLRDIIKNSHEFEFGTILELGKSSVFETKLVFGDENEMIKDKDNKYLNENKINAKIK